MGCCTNFLIVLSLAVAVLIQLGRSNDFFAGFNPILMNEQKITPDSIPNLEGKKIIVTGANTGLGYSTSKHLAANGAKVFMACRSMKKCEKAKSNIASELAASRAAPTFNKELLVPMRLDLASFKSIKQFSDKFIRESDKLDSLILNAGIMHTPFGLTEDGIEQQIGVNHFGHFYLTKLLLPVLEKAQPSTIVSVSSAAQHHSYPEGLKLSLKELNDKNSYNEINAYGQSKLANVLFTQELSARLKAEGKQIFVNAVHPGAVDTDLLRHYPEILVKAVRSFTSMFPNTLFFDSDLAALVEVYAAVSPEIFDLELSGEYIIPIGEVARKNFHANNMKLQRGLWRLSEDIVNSIKK